MVAVITGGVARVELLMTREGLGVMEHLGADITDVFCWVTVLKTKPYNMVTDIYMVGFSLFFFKSTKVKDNRQSGFS